MRKMATIVSLGFAVTLAAVIGSRMSAEAMAVVVGVVCGVAAGIPMSLLILMVLNRKQPNAEERSYGQMAARYGPNPPVVVIQGGSPAPNGSLLPYYAPMPAMAEPMERQFRIVGAQED